MKKSLKTDLISDINRLKRKIERFRISANYLFAIRKPFNQSVFLRFCFSVKKYALFHLHSFKSISALTSRASERGGRGGGTMTPGPIQISLRSERPIEIARVDYVTCRSRHVGRKNRRNSGEDLFFFFFFGRSRQFSAQTAPFSPSIWTSQNQNSVIFELSPGPRSALGTPANQTA